MVGSFLEISRRSGALRAPRRGVVARVIASSQAARVTRRIHLNRDHHPMLPGPLVTVNAEAMFAPPDAAPATVTALNVAVPVASISIPYVPAPLMVTRSNSASRIAF